ncbi:tetratricopeptide repeat-containing sulfotransferase family protein [Xanthomonas albilineans]|uniref:tetratricopeptide repeat-containing sulfotransferase family protein n=1 Tax=Xanthomonas albilineans TaxID=29447 RepID=UPI0005F35962|nr:tetratricopeptide repeat-containing sulfotransferase family protein [Xanthomonas albilineans]
MTSLDDTAFPPLTDLLQALEAGHAQVLEDGARRYLQHRPDDPVVSSLLAMSLQMQGQPAQAAALYRALTTRQPQDVAHWNNLGTALRECGEHAQARQAYARACALVPQDPMPHHNLGLLAMDSGDYATAREHLLDAHALAPQLPPLRVHAAMACHECGDFQRVQALIADWRQWPPLEPDTTMELAWLLSQEGDTESACALLQAFTGGPMPESIRAWSRLVLVLERANRLQQAREAAAQLPASDLIADADVRQDASNALAVLAMRDGRWDDAYALLRGLLSEGGAIDTRKQSNLFFALARVCDRLGRPREALAACAQGHAGQVESLAALVPELAAADASPLPVAQYRWDPARHAAARPVIGPGAAASPIFVVGFPRSGTTLLEQMLDAHPQLCAMDERPFLQGLADRLEHRGVAWPDGLGELDDADCAALRAEYWQSVGEVARLAPGQRLVDKNPLNLLRLPLIHRLFPEAPVILALRHPCDVLLSCYMQAFRSPAFALLCSSMQRLAQGYAEAMAFWLYHAALLRPRALELRYEDLVADPQAQVERLGEFLQLEQPERLLEFQRHARAKGFISTPSYAQVVEGINRKGLDRWRAYRDAFEPVLPTLQPLLQRWNYPVG